MAGSVRVRAYDVLHRAVEEGAMSHRLLNFG
jgi:hypothetical protein